jgi:blue copper oxidase
MHFHLPALSMLRLQRSLFFLALLIPAHGVAQSFYNPLFIPPTTTGSTINLTLAPGTHQFWPGINTATFGANGNLLGPTLLLHKGDSVDINVTNNLGEETTLHWHGLHVPSIYDGGPHTVISDNDTWNVHFRIRNESATYWYHPHLHMTTESQVYKGIAGMIIVTQDEDTLLNLPKSYGQDDFPIILQDRTWDVAGQFAMEPLSDSIIVNGTLHPYLNAPAQVVRMRVLNGSSVRNYHIGFSDNRNFQVIASDGSLLDAPYSMNRYILTNGERVEILVDLQGDLGDTLHLMNYGASMGTDIPGGLSGMMGGNSPLNQIDFAMLEIRVVPQTPIPVTSIPASLGNHTPWNTADATVTRQKEFSGNGSHIMGNFFINGLTFDMMYINDTVQLNATEIWELTNETTVAHPFHIHDVSFYLIEHNGNAPAPYEAELKDVLLVRPDDTLRFITKFEDFTTDGTPYMFHCHNLVHEDDGMMGQFVVEDSIATGVEIQKGELGVLVFPNPVADELQLKWDSPLSVDAQIEIRNVEGRLLRKVHLDSGAPITTISLSDLPAGMYLIGFRSGEVHSVYRIVKE